MCLSTDYFAILVDPDYGLIEDCSDSFDRIRSSSLVVQSVMLH